MMNHLDLSSAEQRLLKELSVKERLRSLVATPLGLRTFAEAFYFVRVGFVRVNFILGARAPVDERLWGPLARNLWEELGGGETAAHNGLYRHFLASVGLEEQALVAPPFAEQFDAAWKVWVTDEPYVDALVAMAIYESLDEPDYSALLEALVDHSNEIDLTFFEVHAQARHLDLFAEFVSAVDSQTLHRSAARASAFVLNQQEQMWRRLLHWLEQAQQRAIPRRMVA